MFLNLMPRFSLSTLISLISLIPMTVFMCHPVLAVNTQNYVPVNSLNIFSPEVLTTYKLVLLEKKGDDFKNVRNLVARIHKFYKTVNPDFGDAQPPRILIDQSSYHGPAAFYISSVAKVAYAISIPKSYAQVEDIADIEFIVAHEMAHVYTRSWQSSLYNTFLTATHKGCVDCFLTKEEIVQVNGKGLLLLREIGKHWVLVYKYARYMGEENFSYIKNVSTYPENLHGHINTISLDELYLNLSSTAAQSRSCRSAGTIYVQMKKDLLWKFSILQGIHKFSMRDRSRLAKQSTEFNKFLQICLAEYPYPFTNIIHPGEQNPEVVYDYLQSEFSMSKKEINEIKMAKGHYKKLVKLNQIIKKRKKRSIDFLNSLGKRYFTVEDEADRLGIQYLISKNYSLEQVIQNIAYTNQKISRAAVNSCLANYIHKNIEPPYGAISNSHHAYCWRIWRAKKYFELHYNSLDR